MGKPGNVRRKFRDWRRSRPFWAGVWTVLAGVEILSIPLAPLALLMHEGIAGVSGELMGVFLVILGLTMWFSPGHRVFAGIATLIFSVASLVLSNFGGFVIGFLLGIIGGAMALSWISDGPPRLAQPVPDWSGAGGGPEKHKEPEEPEEPQEPAKPARPAKPATPANEARPAKDAAGEAAFTARSLRMRAIGALPAGGALLAGGLQPMVPHPVAVLPNIAPAPRSDRHAQSQLSVCSLLDGLMGAKEHDHGKPHQDGLHAGPDGPLGLHSSLPRQRTQHRSAPVPQRRNLPAHAPASSPAPSHGGGLIGAVTGLLGLHPQQPSTAPSAPSAAPRGAPAPRPEPSHGTPPAPRHAEPRHGGPEHDTGHHDDHEHDHGHEHDHDSSTLAVGPLRLSLPKLPTDGGMDRSLRPLPLDISIGDPEHAGKDSPWCLPKVSLSLSGAAARYRVPTAGQPFRIRTPLLVLTGLTYHGITSLPTRLGPQRVLVFTAWRVDIASLRQTAPLLPPTCTSALPDTSHPPFFGLRGIAIPPLGIGLPGIGFVPSSAPGPGASCQGELEQDAAPRSTTTATGKPVVLLTKVLSGKLLGLIPVTFTPDMPPPLPPGLTIPIPLFFTHVLGFNQFLGAKRLSVPGLHQTASY